MQILKKNENNDKKRLNKNNNFRFKSRQFFHILNVNPRIIYLKAKDLKTIIMSFLEESYFGFNSLV